MTTLIIVESPAKARTIKGFLGRNYDVKASLGHVRDLPRSRFGIDVENNFEPDYITIRGKGPVLKELRDAAKKADRILLATDPDREGEAIAWHLATALKLKDDKCRIDFREITKDAIKQAVKKPRGIYRPLVDAQQARRVVDRIVGYELSPLLWAKVKRGLSAGRVQSVAVKLIVDREKGKLKPLCLKSTGASQPTSRPTGEKDLKRSSCARAARKLSCPMRMQPGRLKKM